MKKIHSLAVAALAASLLAACSDNVDEDLSTIVVTEIPASATVSTTAYVQYISGLTSSDSDVALGVNNATPPTSETDTPITF